MNTKTDPRFVRALAGHTYAFRLLPIGWVNAGMIADDKRSWWANYYKTTPQLGGCGVDAVAAKVAFMPYCVDGSNFVTAEQVAADALEIL